MRYPLNDQLHVGAKLAAHGRGSDSGDVDVKLEHAYLGFARELAHQLLVFAAGRMSRRFSPAVAEHPAHPAVQRGAAGDGCVAGPPLPR